MLMIDYYASYVILLRPSFRSIFYKRRAVDAARLPRIAKSLHVINLDFGLGFTYRLGYDCVLTG